MVLVLLVSAGLARRVGGRLARVQSFWRRGLFTRAATGLCAHAATGAMEEATMVGQQHAYVEGQLRAALVHTLPADASALAADVPAVLAEQLFAFASRWHGARPASAAASLVELEPGEFDARADGTLCDPRLVKRRLHNLCALVVQLLEISQPNECTQLLDRPAAGAAPADDAGSFEALVRAAVLSRYEHRLSARRTFNAIQAQHTSLRLAECEWATAAHEPVSLRSYAEAAEEMGEREWVQQGFEWCAERSSEFFFDGGWRRMALRPDRLPKWHAPYAAGRGYADPTRACFEARVAASREPPPAEWQRRRLRLCDVGSCYNPFAEPKYASLFEVTALDLWPQREGVLRCDFLDVHLEPEDGSPTGATPETASATAAGTASPITLSTYTAADGTEMPAAASLRCGSFDVVVLSLVLSYLPSAHQRTEMVRRARSLLRVPTAAEPHRAGLLLLVDAPSVSRPNMYGRTKRPDSALSQWLCAAEAVGLRFVRHEVLAHNAHALAFQTVPGPTPPAGAAELLPMPVRHELIAPKPVEQPTVEQPTVEQPTVEQPSALVDELLRWLPDLLPDEAAAQLE
ncbi:hypothetical protein T492DRAFT_1009997 [Pavlovales sp. CCMP2436]|nr:hypothetical protein T492DRAFT_1009997 [Pavlovales sp. CCMP2436]